MKRYAVLSFLCLVAAVVVTHGFYFAIDCCRSCSIGKTDPVRVVLANPHVAIALGDTVPVRVSALLL